MRRRLSGLAATAAALAMLLVPAAASAAGHDPRVTIRCTPDGDGSAADVVIFNGKPTGTGWMHGWTVTAVTTTGKTISQTDKTNPFRMKPHQRRRWIAGFEPQKVSSCTGTILWGSG